MMKRSTKVAILATALLVSVALLSVGFAAWVISTPQKQEVAGNVHAQSASNKSVSFSATVEDGAGIEFGRPSNAAIDEWKQDKGKGKFIWVTNPNGNPESLSVTVTLTFTAGTIYSLSVVDTYANAGSESAWDYGEAVKKEYISRPMYSLAANGDPNNTGITVSENGKFTIPDSGVEIKTETTLIITITYAWGSAFGGRNPYFYYNEQAHTAGSAEKANAALNELYELLGSEEGTTFTFTFTAA